MKADLLGTMTPNDFAAGLDRLCETFEACKLTREDIICELEVKLAELRGEFGTTETLPASYTPLP